MLDLVSYLHKRRIKMMVTVVGLAFLAVIISFNLQFSPSSYFGGKYNNDFVIFLVIYKLVELPILYYLLMHRHILGLQKENYIEEKSEKIYKHTKLLLFLIPQGNTVFGFIAYKLTANVYYFLLFSSIALITLYIIRPNKLLL